MTLTTAVITTPKNATSLDPEEWRVALLISHVTNIAMLTITIWVLLSMIVYGTKRGRWIHKPSSSSLSSGLVYITCTITVILTILRLSTTEILFHITVIPDGLTHCELVCDVDNAAYSACTYAAYCFLWVRLRLIYNHPYVKKRIGKRANLISKIGLSFITVAAAGLMVFYTVPKAYSQSSLGCVYGEKTPGRFLQGSKRNILIAAALVISQSAMIYLCVYPAVRVNFDSIADAENGQIEKSAAPSMCQKFRSVICNTDSVGSPVQLAVRRTLISCIVMVIANIILLIPAVIFIPRSAPAQIRRTVYNLGSFINVFCVLATLGFAVRILTLFIPTCPKREIIKPHRFCADESVLSSTIPVDQSVEQF